MRNCEVTKTVNNVWNYLWKTQYYPQMAYFRKCDCMQTEPDTLKDSRSPTNEQRNKVHISLETLFTHLFNTSL